MPRIRFCMTFMSMFSHSGVDKFFNELEKLMEQLNFSPNRVFNVDETGLCILQSKTAEIVALKGKKR